MKRFASFSIICLLSGFMLACQRDRGVHAGNDEYRPHPAPPQVMKGELTRVDMKAMTIGIRLENGVLQTFKFDDTTSVEGIENPPQSNSAKPGKTSDSALRNLIGKEGSEVVVHWKNPERTRAATKIEVTQLVTAQPPLRHARRR